MKQKQNNGFSVLGLMIILAILAIIASYVVPRWMSSCACAKTEKNFNCTAVTNAIVSASSQVQAKLTQAVAAPVAEDKSLPATTPTTK